MSKTLIKIIDICQSGNIEITFVRQLHHNGLIEIIMDNDDEYVEEDTLATLEQYHTWHYDLEINIAGIEVARNLLDKIEKLQDEIHRLKSR